jgi:hypothetical protein
MGALVQAYAMHLDHFTHFSENVLQIDLSVDPKFKNGCWMKE